MARKSNAGTVVLLPPIVWDEPPLNVTSLELGKKLVVATPLLVQLPPIKMSEPAVPEPVRFPTKFIFPKTRIFFNHIVSARGHVDISAGS